MCKDYDNFNSDYEEHKILKICQIKLKTIIHVAFVMHNLFHRFSHGYNFFSGQIKKLEGGYGTHLDTLFSEEMGHNNVAILSNRD